MILNSKGCTTLNYKLISTFKNYLKKSIIHFWYVDIISTSTNNSMEKLKFKMYGNKIL